MQYTHPEMLWGLFLLIIPIIIHLFQLRKFRKEVFTNVALLQKIEIRTRKRSQLKKWLIFISRMLATTAIIIAFAQPYYGSHISAEDHKDKELVIYLDNSFSMQARDNNGTLLKKAIQQVIENIPEDLTFTLFTNDKLFKNTSLSEIRDELLGLTYTPQHLNINDAISKGLNTFDNRKIGNTLILLSDFQQHQKEMSIQQERLSTLHFVKLVPQPRFNIAIDSLYISEKKPDGFALDVMMSHQGADDLTVPVSLFDGEELIAKSSIRFDENTATSQIRFEVASAAIIKGKLSIETEDALFFDNVSYFSINPEKKIDVLVINEADDRFLKRIYTEEEFTLTSLAPEALDYNRIDYHDVIVLNALKTIPNALISQLQVFHENGGSIVVIVSDNSDYSTYNSLLKTLDLGTLQPKVSEDKKIINIAYSHPVFKNVFEKQVQNFQYPEVKQYHILTGNASAVLQFENNDRFLAASNHSYLFTAPLDEAHSNFKNSPLIVPIFYNIGKSSIRLPELYYTIGRQNQFDAKIKLQKDRIISLVNTSGSFIPQQQAFDDKVQLITYENPSEAGIYTIKAAERTVAHVSFNYDRRENNLRYHRTDTLNHVSHHNSIPQLFDALKKETQMVWLWKWFVIFALTFLLIEFLLLKLFK